MTLGVTLGENLTMVASANTFYSAIVYMNKTSMKVAASNVNIKIHQLFSKQQILGVHRKISVLITPQSNLELAFE